MSTLSQEFLEMGRKRYEKVSEEETSLARSRNLETYPKTRGTWEVAAIISTSNVKNFANREFLNSMKSIVFDIQSPKIWSFDHAKYCQYAPPRVYLERWENFAVNHCSDTNLTYEYFNIYDPTGKFYHIRSLDDDLYFGNESRKPSERFDIHLPFVLSTRAIDTILRLTKLFEVKERKCIEFSFRWKGLSNRKLASWLRRERYFNANHEAYQDDITVSFCIERAKKLSVLYSQIYCKLLPVYRLFNEFEPGSKRIEAAIADYFND